MTNDKAFHIYAALLVSGVITLLTVIVTSGVAAVPAPLFLAEHLGLGLLFRASYKSLESPQWPYWKKDAEEAADLPIDGALGAQS